MFERKNDTQKTNRHTDVVFKKDGLLSYSQNTVEAGGWLFAIASESGRLFLDNGNGVICPDTGAFCQLFRGRKLGRILIFGSVCSMMLLRVEAKRGMRWK